MNTNIDLLTSYKDKAYIMGILCEQSYNHYSFIKNMINIPLILINSTMTVLNSIIDNSNDLKIPNILLNSTTGLIIAFTTNFKVYERINSFHQSQSKYNKLYTDIEKILILNPDEITNEKINNIIETYEALIDNMEFSISNRIKERVKKEFNNKLNLPSILSVDIVECKDKCNCC
jgi:hypothetical protein